MRLTGAIALLWGFLAVGVQPCAAQVAGLHAEHVIIVSVDGLGGTYLQQYLAGAPTNFPTFARLRREGATTCNARCDYTHSETVPNHTTLFTARPVLQPPGLPPTVHHGFSMNYPLADYTVHANGNPAVPYKSSFFDVAHDHGLSTALFAGKSRIGTIGRSYNGVNGAPDRVGPADDGLNKIDFSLVLDYSTYPLPTTSLVTELLNQLAHAPPRLVFLHMTEPDYQGHSWYWGSPTWSNTIQLIDRELGRIVDLIATHAVLSNRTALIVTADHGGGGGGILNNHTQPMYMENYTVPFFVWGPGVPAALDAYRLFGNRADPGTNRVSYTAQPQPLRNGDAGNLALDFLHLPPIPGSFMRAECVLDHPRLGFDPRDGGRLDWPTLSAGFVLERATRLLPRPDWEPVTNGFLEDGQRLTFPLPQPAAPQAFYRLRGVR